MSDSAEQATNPGEAVGGPPSPQRPHSAPPESGEAQIRGQRRRQQGAAPRPAVTNAPADVRRAPVARAILGETSTLVSCPDAASVLYLLPLLQPYGTMKPAFVISSADAYQVTGALGAIKADVVLLAALMLEPLTRNRLNMAAIFAKAGARVSLRPAEDSPEGYATLRFQLAELVRHGLDRDTALRSITLSPAEMLGISDRTGSIDIGRDGNLLLLDADPLDAGARVRTVLLEGRTIFDDAGK